ncbi:MAG TPA: hypothetical protein VEA60_08360 [Allosphingosinicella sp.]|nr:hypothetical protein [Allosphingosinicella sp.]
MSGTHKKRILATVAMSVLIAAAATAAETPDAPTEQPKSAKEKAYDEEMARYARDKARSEAQTAASDARKAANEARAAEAGSALGTLGSYDGADGKVSITDGEQSLLEATLLSSVALRKVAAKLGMRLCKVAPPLDKDGKPVACASGLQDFRPLSETSGDEPSAGAEEPGCDVSGTPALAEAARGRRAIIIVPEDSSKPIAAAVAFDVRAVGVGRELCSALEAAKRTTAATDGLRREVQAASSNRRAELAGGLGPAALIGTAVNAASNLLRTDYTLHGITVAADQNLFVRELARAVRATNMPNPIYTPSLFPVGQASADNAAIARLAMLDRLRARALGETSEQHALSLVFEQALANAGDRTASIQAAKVAHDAAAERLTAAIKTYDGFVATVTAAEGDAAAPMSAILQEANTAALLRQGGLLVLTKVHFVGGTSYSRQNFFTFLGGMPYHVSGGALASYVVQDGRTGEVYDSIAIPVSGGYVRPTELRRTLVAETAAD